MFLSPAISVALADPTRGVVQDAGALFLAARGPIPSIHGASHSRAEHQHEQTASADNWGINEEGPEP